MGKKLRLIVKRFMDCKNYYDLIELPDGSHIPAPIAIELVGLKEVAKIPVSRKVRDEDFFYCPVCGEYSFFKCWDHYEPPEGLSAEEDMKLKEVSFVSFIRNGKHHKCRYILSIC